MVQDNNILMEEYVLLYHGPTKKWLVRARPGENLHTHLGFVDLGKVLGKEYGASVETSTGETLWVLKPNIYDFVMKSKRKTQIIYPKDLGYLAAKTGISPGMKVIEAGTGSGAMTTFVANLVRPHGHVYTYEVNEEFLELAKANLKTSNLSEYVTLVNADATTGMDVRDADVALIDVGDPWSLVLPMKSSLKGGGMLASVSPTVNQVEKMSLELAGNDFVDIETVEVMVRRWEVRPGMTRPSMRMIGHTAYLTTARNVLK